MISTLALAAAISLRVLPSVCNAPCQVTLTVVVEKNDANRKVDLQLANEEGDYERNSQMDMNEYAPRIVQLIYKGIPRGTYTFKATLRRNDGTIYTTTHSLKVIGFE